jgi:hypothetical protein
MVGMASEIIRIVPIHPGATPAAPDTLPTLTYRGGALLAAVEVFTIFWGKAWVGPQAAMGQSLRDFFSYLLTSPLLDQLAEYSTAATKIGAGSVTGSAAMTDSEPSATLADADVQAQLTAWIAGGAVPQPTANSLYFIYLPPGVTADLGGGQKSCSSFCGYHESIGGNVFYALMPFPDCNGCRGGLTTLEALTSTSSHELCEAITDPVPGQGWYDDANGEIGDICAWRTKTLDGWTVQLEWSNQQNACV